MNHEDPKPGSRCVLDSCLVSIVPLYLSYRREGPLSYTPEGSKSFSYTCPRYCCSPYCRTTDWVSLSYACLHIPPPCKQWVELGFGRSSRAIRVPSLYVSPRCLCCVVFVTTKPLTIRPWSLPFSCFPRRRNSLPFSVKGGRKIIKAARRQLYSRTITLHRSSGYHITIITFHILFIPAHVLADTVLIWKMALGSSVVSAWTVAEMPSPASAPRTMPQGSRRNC